MSKNLNRKQTDVAFLEQCLRDVEKDRNIAIQRVKIITAHRNHLQSILRKLKRDKKFEKKIEDDLLYETKFTGQGVSQ